MSARCTGPAGGRGACATPRTTGVDLFRVSAHSRCGFVSCLGSLPVWTCFVPRLTPLSPPPVLGRDSRERGRGTTEVGLVCDFVDDPPENGHDSAANFSFEV